MTKTCVSHCQSTKILFYL